MLPRLATAQLARQVSPAARRPSRRAAASFQVDARLMVTAAKSSPLIVSRMLFARRLQDCSLDGREFLGAENEDIIAERDFCHDSRSQ